MATHEVIPFPKMRRLVGDIGWLVHNRVTMGGFVEIDVSQPRQLIRQHKAETGEALSFTAFLSLCVAHAVNEDKRVQALLDWRGRFVIFDEVDIATQIERTTTGGQRYPLAHIIRAANKKSLRQIHDEIREVQAAPMTDREARSLSFIVTLPRAVRRTMLWVVAKSPQMRKKYMGTVSLSAVGMFGNKSGWGLSPNYHSLGLIVGGITEKPGAVAGHVEIREYLSLTLAFDHDIVDGAPAARFARQLADLIETAHGFDDIS
jgi:pyruvate/2-oxoglutarate dehydrogenase complex dihydrolipoamide acyltransferase (E2) component